MTTMRLTEDLARAVRDLGGHDLPLLVDTFGGVRATTFIPRGRDLLEDGSITAYSATQRLRDLLIRPGRALTLAAAS